MLKENAVSDRVALSQLVCSAIALACGREASEVSSEMCLMELNIDSLTLVSLLAQVEAIYSVEFQTDQILELLNADRIEDLINLLTAFHVFRPGPAV